MRSLSVKLTLIYVVSILLITGGMFFYLEKQNQEKDLWAAMSDDESGLCSLDGAFPDAADFQALTNNPDNRVTSADINNRLARFTHLIGFPFTTGAQSYQTRIDSTVNSPANPLSQDYFAITFFNITDNGIKQSDISLTIPRNNFSATIGAFNHFGVRSNNLYYKQVPGHDNLIYLVSMNDYTFPFASLKPRLEYDMQKVLPIAFIFSVVFGFLISWITASPLKRITRAAEGLSRSDLSHRVKYKSNDEIGRLALSFNTMADRLEDSFNSQKRFVSDAAHELRTPLASMKTSVTRAQINERNTVEYQKLLDFLSGRITHMETLVNDLLFLSRVDEGKLKSNAIVLDLSKLLTEAEESFRCLFEDKNINFTSEITADLYVKADRMLILRVISNLLDNAAKNTSSGGSVSLAAIKQNNEVIITIRDTGAGISPEHLPHIFERFYKVPGSVGTNNGYGLGLAISKSILLAVGGEISVQSEPGKGSIFTIKLPLSDPDLLLEKPKQL